MNRRIRRESPPCRSGSSPMSSTLARGRSASPRDGDPTRAVGTPATVSGGSTGSRRAAHTRDIPACDRCRSFKKKCSRTFPVCTLCANAGQKCSFSTPVTSSAAEAHHLRARVEWLTRYINENLPAGTGGIERIETGTDLSTVLSVRNASSTAGSHLELGLSPAGPGSTPGSASVGSHSAFHTRDATSAAILYDQRSVEVNLGGEAIPARGHLAALLHPDEQLTLAMSSAAGRFPAPVLPRDAAARRFIDAYFRNVNKAYPFVDRAKVLRNLESIKGVPGSRGNTESTLLYLIMAIGCTTLQRAGQIPSDTASKFDIAYADIIQECLAREDVESVQILVALGLYSLFDPKGASVWSIVGIACRKAMLLGLSRKASSEDKALSPTDVELRRRLFWSLYVLDRMTAISMGHSVALIDDNMDVPLPGLTVEEFASPEKPHVISILQTNRHVIQLRQIEDRILREIHLKRRADVAALSRADRRAVLQDVRASIEDWYSHGCLVSPLEPDNVPIHSSVAWQSARYYHLLVLLYYPCHFNSFGPVPAAELLRFAQKHLQSTSVLLEQQLLPLNKITLCRLFPVGLVLLQSFMSSAGSGGGQPGHHQHQAQHHGHGHDSGQPPQQPPFPARDEVAVIIGILQAFPDGWTQAHQVAHIFRQFMAVASGVSGDGPPLHVSAPLYGGGSFELGVTRELYQALLRPVVAGLLSVMQEVLGRATCYAFCEPLLDYDREGGGGAGVQQQQQQQPLSGAGGGGERYHTAAALSPLGTAAARTPVPFAGVPGNDVSSMSYDWGSVELGFI
ncbi:Protein STB5-like protein 3 [Pleurostoma richardsiae]|uniref:Protein STB5-like protein 3 n=1 Tax=Pleurostoma richardsiae TaxID=41990 RepID=A0AA38S7A7_9PEZI|nr:Protein STB5-like protein 3 [Pleurostoma richardsiae]